MDGEVSDGRGGAPSQATQDGAGASNEIDGSSGRASGGVGEAVAAISNEDRRPAGNSGRRVAILGTAEPHWRHAPFQDEGWEIWTCGGIYGVAPRIDRHFEIHDKMETCKGWGDATEEAAQREVYWKWIADQGGKCVLKEVLPETPNATRFPIEALCEMFQDKYFTNTISYMIALAIAEGATEIGLWGIDMALSSSEEESDEYGRQRPSVEFYLGVATGMGIPVHLPPETTLLKSRKLYGFDGPVLDDFNMAAQAKIHELSERKRQIEAFIHTKQREIEQAEKDLSGASWAIDVAGYFKRNLER